MRTVAWAALLLLPGRHASNRQHPRATPIRVTTER
jgi:hypothetical protein